MSDTRAKVERLPVAHRDIGVRLMEIVKQTPDIKAGVFIAIDADMRSTRVMLHAGDVSVAHIGLVIADLEQLKARLVALSEESEPSQVVTDD